MDDFDPNDARPITMALSPLFVARWSYRELERVMPFGPGSEGQAYGYSSPAHVRGERVAGGLRLFQYPRWRVDQALLPDFHGVIRTESNERIVVRGAGFGLHVPEAPGRRRIAHWLHFSTDAPGFAWLNTTIACGVGTFADEVANVSYFAVAPGPRPSSAGSPSAGEPAFDLLGTATWTPSEDETVHQYGDDEGVGLATSAGRIAGGPLDGAWRGWLYPTFRRDGTCQIDGHAEVRAGDGVVLIRQGGLETPREGSADIACDVVEHATFVTEHPQLESLNRTLAFGVGFAHPSGSRIVTYYGLAGP